MKSNGLIVALVILLSIIVFFLVMFLVVYLKGGATFMNFGSSKNDVIFDETFSMENIQSIDIEQDAGDIIFKETTNDNIQVVLYGDGRDTVNVNVVGNKLSINYTVRKNFALLNFGTVKKDVVVYIPSIYSSQINIRNRYGNTEIPDLENVVVNIEADCRKCKYW